MRCALSTSVEAPTSVSTATVTTQLEIVDTTKLEKWKMFRILDPSGRVLENAVEPLLEKNTLLEMYKMEVRIQALDEVFYNLQRQGRISFYMQAAGEESIHIGKANRQPHTTETIAYLALTDV